MKARIVALVSVAFAASASLSCSSSDTPPVSGGAQFQLQSAGAATPMGDSSCPESSEPITVATKTTDGFKLIVDGDNNAIVKCQVDGSHFSVLVSYQSASIGLSGSLQGSASSDTQVNIITATGNTYATRNGQKCAVTVTNNAGGDFQATFSCPVIEHTKIPAACAIGATTTTPSYFHFAHCTGF